MKYTIKKIKEVVLGDVICLTYRDSSNIIHNRSLHRVEKIIKLKSGSIVLWTYDEQNDSFSKSAGDGEALIIVEQPTDRYSLGCSVYQKGCEKGYKVTPPCNECPNKDEINQYNEDHQCVS